jgi:predicted ATPase
MTALHEGDVVAARAHLERGLARYRVEAHHARALAEFGGDPDVSCLAYLGRALWSLGYPDQALARGQEAVRLARERGGDFDTAVAQAMLTSVHQLRREMRAVRETTEGALAHVTERGLPYWRARNLLLLSWAEAVSGPGAPSEAAIEAVRRCLEDYCASGTALGLSWFMSLLAQACAAGGHLDESLAALDAAQAHADATGERFNEVEIHLIRGDVLLMRADGDAAASAEKVLRRAAEIARGQEARGWELRAATRLARHLGSQGRGEEARSLLAPIFGWFTEGHATADLRDARQLLEALGGSRP